MTHLEFITLCNNNLIYPGIALENEDIVKALQDRDDQRVINLLEEQF